MASFSSSSSSSSSSAAMALPEPVQGYINLSTLGSTHKCLAESQDNNDLELATWIKQHFLYEPIQSFEDGRPIKTREGFQKLFSAYQRVQVLTNRSLDKWPFFDNKWKEMKSAVVKRNAGAIPEVKNQAAPKSKAKSSFSKQKVTKNKNKKKSPSPAPSYALPQAVAAEIQEINENTPEVGEAMKDITPQLAVYAPSVKTDLENRPTRAALAAAGYKRKPEDEISNQPSKRARTTVAKPHTRKVPVALTEQRKSTRIASKTPKAAAASGAKAPKVTRAKPKSKNSPIPPPSPSPVANEPSAAASAAAAAAPATAPLARVENGVLKIRLRLTPPGPSSERQSTEGETPASEEQELTPGSVPSNVQLSARISTPTGSEDLLLLESSAAEDVGAIKEYAELKEQLGGNLSVHDFGQMFGMTFPSKKE